MIVCPACGFENVDQARFCGGCAAPLQPTAAPAREARKTVTVVFCDVTGSTALGERLDPESLRRVMARYFDVMREAIERHGGAVEKFIGDAVMAVFGVPVVHEDDALRAVRAAAEMRERLAALNEEFERDYGTRLELRIGVNTGEVVTGTEERLATGDAVNVAARLEQAAQPGEILVGRGTLGLVRQVVRADELGPLELKGKAAGVVAYRLRSVEADAPARRLDVRMVGRRRELRLLEDAWERAVSERSCVLFTLLGVAGVGKSRLIHEFLDGLDASVLRGRCLSYGEGITYWAVTEVVKQLQSLGFEATGPVATLLGEGDAATSPEEIAWGFRQLLELATAERPVLLVFDDVHWGESTFLDLAEHVATMSRNAPILLLCVARPELLDRRPSWSGGLLNATTVLLEPLSAEETDELIGSLGGGLDADLAARIRVAAEGNPLFVEEMLALVEEGGDGEVAVPPTVQALLAARLDQLDAGERGVLECGSVEGQVFHRGAVQALGAPVAELTPRLTALVRKELVRPETPTLAGDDAYRFRHILIRDAAYDALPKATRAELHERFAAWLDGHADLVEQDEIVGYHLEQAYRYRAELGPVDGAGEELAGRAAGRLLAGGRSARERGDVGAAASLLGRGLELLRAGDSLRLELLPELAAVLLDFGDFARAGDLLGEAAADGDEKIRARARLGRRVLSTLTEPTSTGRFDLEEVGELVDIFERLRDDEGLADALCVLARLWFYSGRCAEAEAGYARAVELARRLGDRRREREALDWLLGAKRFGPTPATALLEYMGEVIEANVNEPRLVSSAQVMSASATAMQGRFAEARMLVTEGGSMAANMGIVPELSAKQEGALVELLAGDARAAAETARLAWDRLGAIGETGFRSTTGGILAEALAATGEDEQAEAILDQVSRLAQADDIDPQIRLRMLRARLLAKRGELAEAERLAREAVAIVDATDYIDLGGDAHLALGDVLAAAGRDDEAASELRAALERYERKGNLVRAGQVRERLSE